MKIDLAKSVGKTAKSVAKGKFQPPRLRNRLTDFDEIRTSDLPPKTSHRAKFHFDPTTWVVSENTQHDWNDTISGVHVSPGSADTFVSRGGITNHYSIAYCLSNTSAKSTNYQHRLMCVEVTVCNISVVFLWHSVDTSRWPLDTKNGSALKPQERPQVEPAISRRRRQKNLSAIRRRRKKCILRFLPMSANSTDIQFNIALLRFYIT